MWRSGNWFSHRDNAHSALRTREFLARYSITVILLYLPYSLDIAPCNFFLFPKLKIPLKLNRFETISEIEANVTKELKDIAEEAFQDFFNYKWIHCWNK